MKNIIDYAEQEMNTMKTKMFNQVDSLILSQFAYFKFDQMVPGINDLSAPVRIGDLLKAEMFDIMFPNSRDTENNRRLLFALAASPRFRNITMNYYIDRFDPEMEKQFSAVTYHLEDNTSYIAYRGTDATLIGWKEDFNMAFKSPVPSQEDSVGYLNSISERFPGPLRTGGHSKGGNLAVYSAMKCRDSVQNRIISIFNHDGPGFMKFILESPEFQRIKERIAKTLPQSSLVGMLLQDLETFSVVESNRFGIMQHDPFSWAIDKDDFIYVENLSNSAVHMYETIDKWLSGITDEQRETFINTLFQVFEKTNAQTFNELSDDWQKNAVTIANAVKNIDPNIRAFVIQTINELVKLSIKSRISEFRTGERH